MNLFRTFAVKKEEELEYYAISWWQVVFPYMNRGVYKEVLQHSMEWF